MGERSCVVVWEGVFEEEEISFAEAKKSVVDEIPETRFVSGASLKSKALIEMGQGVIMSAASAWELSPPCRLLDE